ncbi:MAG: Shedu anti-phage system protein SduA domain-containing protein [Bacteroidota bacterium]
MSVQYQKEILSNEKLKLYINFSGIDEDDTTNKSSIGLNIYAIDPTSFKTLFSAVLKYDEIKLLFDHLSNVSIIKDGTESVNKFVEISNDVENVLKYIKTLDGRLLKILLDKIDEKEKLKLVLEALNESEIQNLHATIRQTNHKKALSDLKDLLVLEKEDNIVEAIKVLPDICVYKAGQAEKIFQNWIEKNIWALGVDYIKKHPARQIGIASESDIIMQTTDGFIDLIELKRPSFELFQYDESHKTYFPSKELSKVIGQCLQYLKILDNYKLVLETTYKFNLLRPRIKIIMGRSEGFNDLQFETLRMLNSNLTHILIITYDYLYQCGENIISYYDEVLEEVIERPTTILPTVS